MQQIEAQPNFGPQQFLRESGNRGGIGREAALVLPRQKPEFTGLHKRHFSTCRTHHEN